MDTATRHNKIRVYERVATVYDMVMPNGQVYRWDTVEEARNFARVHQLGIKLKKISPEHQKSSRALVLRTTPDALVRKRVVRKLVKNQPHVVEKE